MGGLGRRVRDHEPLRLGVAHVLGREDHHATGHEHRVFARFQHAGEVVDGGVGIARAHALDEGRDHVVVLFARLVVAQVAMAERGAEQLHRQLAVPGLEQVHGQLEAVERPPGVPFHRARERPQQLVGGRDRAGSEPALAVLERAAQQ